MKNLLTKIPYGIILFSILLTILFTYPSILHLSSNLIGENGKDGVQYASYQALFARNIKDVSYPFAHSQFWRYPVGFDFGRSFDSYLAVVLGGFLTLLFGITLGYNLSLFLLMVLNGVFSFFFFSKISNSKSLGVLGMIIYGFSFYSLSKALSHPNLLFVAVFPILGLSILNLIKKQKLSQKDFLFFFGSLLLVSLTSLVYFLYLFMLLPLIIFVSFFVFKTAIISLFQKILEAKKQLILPFLIFCGLLVFFFFQTLASLATGHFIIFERRNYLFEFTPSIKDYFLPNPYLPLLLSKFFSNNTFSSIERVVFLGWAEIIFFILFFFSKIKKSVKIFIGTIFAVFLLLSMGYGKDNNFPLLPYLLLQYIFPFSSLVETGRFIIISYFFLTFAIILFLRSIEDKKRNILIALLVIAAIIERLPLNFYFSDNLGKKAFIPFVQKQDSGAVLDLPLNLYYAPYNLLSFYYNKPIVNGYFHWSADGAQEKAFVTDRGLISRYECSQNNLPIVAVKNTQEDFDDQEMIDLLRKNDVRTIVIHKDDKFFHPVCRDVRIRLERLLPFTAEAQTTSDKDEKQIKGSSITGTPAFNIDLPYNGTFYIDGVFIDPASPANFKITINGLPPSFSYTWNRVSEKGAIELSPKYTLSFDAPAGSVLSFASDNIVDSSSFSLWYRYVKKDNFKFPFNPVFQKVFEDQEAIVYKLN